MSAATVAVGRSTLAERLEPATDFLRLLRSRPMGLVGFAGIVFFVLLAYVAPFVFPLNDTVDVGAIYQTPSLAHPLGTDFQGRDVLSAIIHGGRDIISVAILSAFLATLIAVTLGSLAATLGGSIDAALTAFTDVVLTIPGFVLLVVVAALARPTNLIALAVLLAALHWAGLMRQVRSQVLTLKEREYVEAARSLDLGTAHIVFREILPNMRSYIVIHYVLAMTGAIYSQVGLILLGLVPFSGQSWGIMLYFADTQGGFYFRDAAWFVFSPIVAIVLLQLSLVFFVSALEDIFNPRLRSG